MEETVVGCEELTVVKMTDFNNADQLYLNNLLKTKLNNSSDLQENEYKKFSLEFEPVVCWVGVDCMDLVFSYQYDCFIVNDMKYLKSCKRADHNNIKDGACAIESFNQVQYEVYFQSMKLLTERGEDFIYANYRTEDDSTDGIVKIRVSDLMKGETTLIWDWKVGVDCISGFDVFNNKVYIVSKDEILVLDSKNGQSMSDVVVPEISINNMFILVLSDSRLLLASDTELQLLERKHQAWGLVSKLDIAIDYLSYYEEDSNMIYLATQETISVIKIFNNGEFELVKTFADSHYYPNAMKVDRRTGFLYTCSAFNCHVSVYK